MRLSKNFTLEEFERSDTAKRLKIDNHVPQFAVPRLRTLCEKVLQPVRDHFGVPIIITSGYRCPDLNDAVKGATSSQHMKGEAADFKIRAQNIKLYDIYLWMVDNLQFDQLIWEVRPNSKWIHVSYKATGENRQQVFTCRG
jgi:uncharacterized protein YcbK (DUF882 family)